MKTIRPPRPWSLVIFASVVMGVSAQTTLPRVDVTAPAYITHHGGYVISGNFRIDPRMPNLVFPARALVKDDILSVQPVHLTDDEYLVLQECATSDCSEARLVRVWNADGAATAYGNSENRIWITHENKYWIWLQRLPDLSGHECTGCGFHYHRFALLSPPMTLVPTGQLAAATSERLRVAESRGPVPVQAQLHESSIFVVTFQGGSTVRLKRMHAAR